VKALRDILDLLALMVSLPFYLVGLLAGAIYGAVEFSFVRWVRYWRSGEVILVLFIPAVLLGCGKDKESWYADRPAKVYTSNGFSFSFYGPRETGYAPDVSPALDAGAVTVEEIGLALEASARQLAARAPVDPEAAVAVLRGIEIQIVDDYSFQVSDGRWATGVYLGNRTVVALWGKREVLGALDVPVDAPLWTIRAGGAGWRYGARPLVPATDHELGHHFYGPYFEH
jgi:hypothetical protein